jgi:DNA processing protein
MSEIDLPPEAHAAALAMLPKMGPARLLSLVREHGPAGAWRRTIGGQLGDAWAHASRSIDPVAVLRDHHAAGVGLAALGGAAYPAALADDIEPPAVVFARGDLGCIAPPAVAIIGTRRCTRLGAGIARELGHDLAASGVQVVSGLALGIDGAAHRGALAAGATPPVAVVGSGLDVVYPRANADLWEAVGQAGVVISEAPLGARPEPWRFPARNRIIAGLADVVVVVESHAAGGSLLTVNEAAARDVEVMAVPGSVRSSAAAGTNALLADGRAPVRDADDVLLTLGLMRAARPQTIDRRPEPSGDDAALLGAFEWQPVTAEHLALRTGLSLLVVGLGLARLEADGWIATHGGWYERLASPPG